MSASNGRTGTPPFGIPMAMPGGGQEIYEQLLALADTVGAAFTEAFQQITAAYTEAYQKGAPAVAGLQDKLAGKQPADWLAGLPLAPSGRDPMGGLTERALAISDGATDMGRKVALAFLEAGQQALLAAVDWQEQLGEASDLDLVKSIATAQAELVRTVTRAGVNGIREIVA